MREAGGFRMGPFELMDLIGLDVNFAVTKSVWEAYFHDPRFAPSILQYELVAAGFLGRKTGRGYYRYGADAERPAPATEAAQPRPRRVRAAGDGPLIAALCDRLAASGFDVAHVQANAAIAPVYVAVEGTILAPTDGRTATAVAVASGERNVVLFDLAFDYRTCTRLAVAPADTCTDSAYSAAVGALQAAGIAVSRVEDIAGLAVMRTVAMLANEAADAVTQGIANARDVDLAMRNGVNYPRGPLAWADAIGLAHVTTVLRNLEAHYGDPRYRTSPLLARRCATGSSLTE
jgi:3-hydroxybutyryl-CoA dehydrogenase